MDVKLRVLSAALVDVKDPTVSFAKSRRAIAGTLNKLQFPALTGRDGTVTTSDNDASLQPRDTFEQD